jgi:hypothetical protein
MTQTVDGITGANLKIEWSENGSVWTDISGSTNSIEIGGGDRNVAEAFTFVGDTPILGVGKRGTLEMTVNVIYTETTGEGFEAVRDNYEGGLKGYIRYSPRGGSTGQKQYTSDPGYISAFQYPGAKAEGSEMTMCTFVLKTPKLTPSVI